MKQLRYLSDVYLCRIVREKSPLGETFDKVKEIDKYKCYVVDITDSIENDVSGATIRNTKRIFSVRSELENYLIDRFDYKGDNATTYRLKIGTKVYAITSLKDTYVDAKLI